jgi:hypothetical protein
MKPFTLLAILLAIPVGIASSQTSTATTSTANTPYIPLFSSGGANTSGTGNANSTWFIDTTNKIVVLCAQTGTSGSGAPSFTCTAHAVPLAVVGAIPPAGANSSGTGIGTPAASGTSGMSPSVLINPFGG